MQSLTSRIGNDTFVTVAADAESLLGDTQISGHGTSRCMASDVYDAEIGEGIALGRAIQDFGRQVEQAFLARVVTTEEFHRVMALFPPDQVIALAFGALLGGHTEARQTEGEVLTSGLLVEVEVGA